MSRKSNFTYIKDKKIAIYRPIKGKSSYGDIYNSGWEPLTPKRLWACYQSLKTDLRLESYSQVFDAECNFFVNWRNDIEAGMHVLFRDKPYEVVRIDDFEGYKKDLKLTCKSVMSFELSDYPVVK